MDLLSFADYRIITVSCLLYYFFIFSDNSHKRDGKLWPAVQMLNVWKRLGKYFKAKINTEIDLDDNQLYIFCNFPHGACTVNHLFTMTDCCGMLSNVYRGERRGEVFGIFIADSHSANIRSCCFNSLFYSLCTRNASAKTAHHNLAGKKSILIFVGGEKEQLMTTPGKHKIYLNDRKGFVKLALQYGAHLVPMYAFGENEAYQTSTFVLGFRKWLQRNFQIGISIAWGRWYTPIPFPVEMTLEIGKPVPVDKREGEITADAIDELHAEFVKEMKRLFNRTKLKNGCSGELEIF